MGDKFRADYNQLNNIANVFNQQADAINSMNQGIRSCFEDLKGGNWIGKGADKFNTEMQDSVLPKLQRLQRALASAARATKKISQVAKQAEEESSNCLNGSGLSV